MSVPAKDWSQYTDRELARILFDCDPVAGTLHWRFQVSNFVRAGDRAGRLKPNGYRDVRFRGRQIAEHRVIWLWVHGGWPQHQIDHIDGDRSNNSIDNLRDVPGRINAQNIRKPRGEFVGVSQHQCGKYQATIGLGGRAIYLGLFLSPEEARSAYLTAKAELHPGSPILAEVD